VVSAAGVDSLPTVIVLELAFLELPQPAIMPATHSVSSKANDERMRLVLFTGAETSELAPSPSAESNR
jgi:hypothetical protein